METIVKDITCWYCQTKEGSVFNHIENGHSEFLGPLAKTNNQAKAWLKIKWIKKHAELVDGVVCNER